MNYLCKRILFFAFICVDCPTVYAVPHSTIPRTHLLEVPFVIAFWKEFGGKLNEFSGHPFLFFGSVGPVSNLALWQLVKGDGLLDGEKKEHLYFHDTSTFDTHHNPLSNREQYHWFWIYKLLLL